MFIYTHIRDTEIRDTPLPHFPHIKGVGILNPRQIIQWGFLFMGGKVDLDIMKKYLSSDLLVGISFLTFLKNLSQKL